MIFQIFGSASSLDVDLVVFVEEISSIKAANDLAYSYKIKLQNQYKFEKPLNLNIACVENGRISATYKGTIDELNNSLFHTYHLHQQYFPQQIEQLLPRDMELKMVRCSRKITSFFSRTTQRVAVKKALRGDFLAKIEFLSQLQLDEFTDYKRKGSQIDFNKTAAFQLGQTLALMNGIELYTKEGIIEHFPSLEPHLMRKENASIDILQKLLDEFVKKSNVLLPTMTRMRE